MKLEEQLYQVLRFEAWALQNPQNMAAQLHRAGGLEFYTERKDSESAYFLFFLKTKFFIFPGPKISNEQFQVIRRNAGINEVWWKNDP